MNGSPSPRRPIGRDGEPDVPPMAESPALSASAYTLTGLLVFGVLGWLVDRLLGISALLPVGLVVGVAVGLSMVWVRYGKPSTASNSVVPTSAPRTTAPPTSASTASGQPPVPANDGRRPRPDPTTTYEEGQ